MSRYNIKGLPWSSGLGKDVSDCITAKDVMRKAKLDFFVDKCELVAEMPIRLGVDNSVKVGSNEFARNGYVYRPCPNAYATYRTDTNIPLGLVKSKYEVIQNIDAFDFFDEAIGKDKAVWQTAGLFGYGERIFVSAKLPITTYVNDEPIDNYLVFSNSHDGSSSINIMFTPIRVACTNMLNSALKNSDSYIRIRHTQSAKEKLESGSRILHIACKYAVEAQQLYKALTTINMTDQDVMKYLSDLILSEQEIKTLNEFDKENGYKKLIYRDYMTMERTNISTRKANQIATMWEYYLNGIAQKNIIGTAWGAYNAVTGYYSNVANIDGSKRMDSLLYGTANLSMNKALNVALTYNNVA